MVPPLVPLPGPPERAGLSGESDRVQWLFPEPSLTHCAETTQSAGGPLGGAGPVKPGGPEGSDAVSSESEKPPTWLPVAGIRTVGDGL